MTTQALDVLGNVELDIEALAVPTATGAVTSPGSWTAGPATPTMVLTVIATALNILYTISDGSGIGTTMSNVSGKLASLLQDTATALVKLSDNLGSATDVNTALTAAIAALPASGNAAQLLTQCQNDVADLQSQVDAVGVQQIQIDLYKMAQELNAIGKALTPGA
jgi:hypothetical protein